MQKLVENVFLTRELYQTILAPVCSKHNITQTEAMVLLFLANYLKHDTATDIVEKLRLTKSAVSTAARDLQERGFIKGKFVNGNHRSIHLELCKAAEDIVKDGNEAQKAFYSVVVNGFEEEELEKLKSFFKRVAENISAYHRNDGDVPDMHMMTGK